MNVLDNERTNKEKIEKLKEQKKLFRKNKKALKNLKTISPNDIITFGSYYKKDCPEPIEWIILKRCENKALLISLYAIDNKTYNISHLGVTWETCYLRKWLNDEFLNIAFTNIERNMILNTNIHTNDNPIDGAKGGNDTTDKVFLLSVDEVEQYFPLSKERKCLPTKYTKKLGAYTSSNETCYWWLRSPGVSQYDAANVCYDGDVYYYGFDVINDLCVRPALWIKLES